MKHYHSRKWFEFRKCVISAKKLICDECGRTDAPGVVWQVHHPNPKYGVLLPWQYTFDEVMLVCKGCHAKLHGKIQPSGGWSLDSDDDLGAEDGYCDECGRSIRYVFYVSHPEWPSMSVGTNCCDRLTESSNGQDRKSFLERLERFSNTALWQDERHKKIRKYKGFAVCIWSEESLFNAEISGRKSKDSYHSFIDASRACLIAIEIQLNKANELS